MLASDEEYTWQAALTGTKFTLDYPIARKALSEHKDYIRRWVDDFEEVSARRPSD